MTTTTAGRGLLLGIAAALAMSACVPVRYEYRRPVIEEAVAVCTPDYPCANAYYWDEYRSVYVFYDGYRYWDATGYAGAYPLPGPNVAIYGCPRGYVPPSSMVYPQGRFVPPPPGRYHPATPGGYAGYTPPGRGGGNGYVPPGGGGIHGASAPPGYGGGGTNNGYTAPPPGRGGYGAPPPSVGSNGNYVGPVNSYAPPPRNGSAVTGESAPPRENGVGVEPSGGQHNGYVAPGGYVPQHAGETAGPGSEPGGFNAPPPQVSSHGGYTGPGNSGAQPGNIGYAPPPNHLGAQPGYTGVPQTQGGEFGGGPSRANNFTPPPPVRQMPYKVDLPPVQSQYMPNRNAFGGSGGAPPMQGQPPAAPAKKSASSGPAPGPSRGSGGFSPRGGGGRTR